MNETFEAAVARLAATMAPVDTKQPRFRGMLYSESGVGKSVLSAQIMQALVPSNLGIVYIDTAEGWVSLRNHPGLGDRVMYVPFTTIEDVRVVGNAIRNKIGAFAYVGGIILDEGSSMSQIDTDRVFEARRAQAQATGKPFDSLTPEWPDYHAALARFRQMLAELFAIPDLHVIITAHVADKKDRNGNITKQFPSFSPKIAQKVKEPLHLVGHMTATSRPNPKDPQGTPIYERSVQVHPTVMIDAKIRLPINTVKVDAAALPGIIQDWINSGGEEVSHDSTPLPDPEENPLEGLTSEEALEVVDSTENDESFEEFSIEPIN